MSLPLYTCQSPAKVGVQPGEGKIVFKARIRALLGSKRIKLFLCCVVLKAASGACKCSNIF